MFSRLWSHAVLGAAVFSTTVATLFGAAPSQAGTSIEPWIDTSNRDAVSIAYDEEFSHPIPTMDWTGAYDGCLPGESSEALALATVRRVNFYRAMAGVPTGVELNREYSAQAQHGALSMSATGRLSHTPDESFECLSEAAKEAAANSNLYLGRTGPRAIDGYIEDPGERNRDVGHRNTILHPPTAEIGVGHVAGNDSSYPANALWVFDGHVFDDNPSIREDEGFVAWPPRGFVPAELVHPRWSFGLADADFENATVTMSAGGEEIELTVVARLSQQGYVPAPILVWEPVADPGSDDPRPARGEAGSEAGAGEGGPGGALLPSPAYDTEYDIVVSGVVVDGAEVSFSYSVTIMGSEEEGDDQLLILDPVRLAYRATETVVRDVVVAAISPSDG